MMKGYDVYQFHGELFQLLEECQSLKIEIFEVQNNSIITFLSTFKYRKILNQQEKMEYLYTLGILGMMFRFFRDPAKIISFTLAALLLIILNHTIFSVEILGDTVYHQKLIQTQLKEFQPPFLYFDSNEMMIELRKLTQELNWFSIYQQGSRLEIHYLPRKKMNLLKHQQYDLIALKNGVIAHFEVFKGNKVVKVNEYVKKGDVLVSHILFNSSNEEKTTEVFGKVYAFTFKKVEVKIKKNKFPKALQYYECLLRSRNQIRLDENEKIMKEIPLQFEEDFDTIKMINYYVLYEMISGVGESNE